MITADTQVNLVLDRGMGSVQINGTLTGAAGRQIELTAIPNPGYAFIGWKVNRTTFKSILVTATLNGSPVSYSSPIGGTVFATAVASDGSLVQASVWGPPNYIQAEVINVADGTSITFNCVPAAGYKFDWAEWFDNPLNLTSMGTSQNPVFSIIANGTVGMVTAYFSALTVQPTPPPSPSGLIYYLPTPKPSKAPLASTFVAPTPTPTPLPLSSPMPISGGTLPSGGGFGGGGIFCLDNGNMCDANIQCCSGYCNQSNAIGICDNDPRAQ